MSVIWTSKTRQMQPQGLVRPANGYGLAGLWLPGQANKDAASGLALPSTTGSVNPEVGSFGPALGLRASNSSIYGTALAQHKPATAASIVWVGNLYAGVSVAACLGGVTYDDANSVPYVSYELKRSSGSGLNDLFLTWGSGGTFATLISSTAYGTGPVVIVGVVANGSQRLYIRSAAGLEVLSATGAITTLDSSATARVEIGDSLNARTPDASCAMMALVGVAWSDAQARRIVENPWQLFAPERTPVFYSIAGVSPGPSTANRIMLLRRPGLPRVWR